MRKIRKMILIFFIRNIGILLFFTVDLDSNDEDNTPYSATKKQQFSSTG